MSTVLQEPRAKSRSRFAIELASESSAHTRTVNNGGNSRFVKISESVPASQLMQFLQDQCGWNVVGKPFKIGNVHYAAEDNEVMLAPSNPAGGNPDFRTDIEITRELGTGG